MLLCKQIKKNSKGQELKKGKSNQTTRSSFTLIDFNDNFGALPTKQVLKQHAADRFESTSCQFCPV